MKKPSTTKRAIVTPRLALDSHGKSKRVGTLVRETLLAGSRNRVAAAYVTGEDAASLLGLGGAKLRRLELFCDPYGGNCDPATLDRLARKGVRIRCVRRLHAKVYWTPEGAVIGSANISSSAFKGGGDHTIEAAVRVDDSAELETIAQWMDGLSELHDSRDWASLRADKREMEGIHARRKQRGFPPPRGPKDRGVSLLESVRNHQGYPWWRQLVFSVVTTSKVPSAHAKKALATANLRLSDDWTFEEIEGPTKADRRYFGEIANAIDGHGPDVITIRVRLRRGDKTTVADVIEIEEGIERLRHSAWDKRRDVLYNYLEPSPFNRLDMSSTSRRQLTTALRTALRGGKQLSDAGNFARFLSVEQFRALLS